MQERCSEDDLLVARSKAGDLEAFNHLVLKYQDRLFDTIYRMVGDYEEARDLTQECFLKAYAGLKRFRGGSSFYTWLFRIGINCALSLRRRTRRNPTTANYQEPEELGRAAVDPRSPEPEHSLHRREEREAVLRALRKLDPHQRAIIVLRDIEGADYDQLAEILGCPKGTIKSRLHRARQALRRELERLIQT